MWVQERVQIKFKSSCKFFKINCWTQALIQWPKHDRFKDEVIQTWHTHFGKPQLKDVAICSKVQPQVSRTFSATNIIVNKHSFAKIQNEAAPSIRPLHHALYIWNLPTTLSQVWLVPTSYIPMLNLNNLRLYNSWFAVERHQMSWWQLWFWTHFNWRFPSSIFYHIILNHQKKEVYKNVNKCHVFVPAAFQISM